jgi:uncharacterized protein with NAD-binding domain and iron-sulfur cluster
LASQNILIVGGGMAGLSTAFELTRTPELRAKYTVTVYQMGWRLGGKCASGRDAYGRNVEHGLHIWFGYYENAFRLLRDVYREWDPPSQQKIKRAEDAIRPQPFTPVGNSDDKRPAVYDVYFPTNGELPGTGTANLSVWDSLVRILELVATFYDKTIQSDVRLARLEPEIRISAEQHSLLTAVGRAGPTTAFRPALKVGEFLRIAVELGKGVDGSRLWSQFDRVHDIADAMRQSARAVLRTEFARTAAGSLLEQTLDIAAAFAKGLVADFIFGEREIDDVDESDFRQWLLHHGASPDSVDRSAAIFALYDTMFQYPDGERHRASYGAGTAVQVVLRMLGTYQGALAWELQAGTGEVLLAPLFAVLKRRGVQFRFFHKLTKIDVDADHGSIVRLHFDRQVNLRIEQDKYDPLKLRGGLLAWGNEPDWSLIENGDALRDAGVDLESHWCDQNVESIPVALGQFDEAVLAIPLGAFKKLNDEEGPCSALLKTNLRFRTMAQTLPLAPSIAVQAWSDRTLRQLGWTRPKPAMVCAPRPLDVWADMTQLLAYEPDEGGRTAPKSLHYFCNVLATQLHRRPSTDYGVPAEARDLARSLALQWFGKKAADLWPKAVTTRGEFDWGVLCSPSGAKGPDRLGSQIVRANVNPSDCCVVSAAGTTASRLKSDESGFAHLYLCGSWIKTGLNTECVEAAVMSGMQAARAISGQDRQVPGEDFLHAQRNSASPCELLHAGASLLISGLGG